MKTDVRSEHADLVRYFLGELTPEQQERVEERYMIDEEYAELRDQVELDLVDAYVSDALLPIQRQHFELRYLITPKRKEAVHAAYLSKVYRERIAEPGQRARKEKAAASPRRWFIPALAAAALLVVLGSALWLLFHRKESVPNEAKSRTPMQKSSPPSQTAPLSPPTPVAPPSSPQLAKQRRPSAPKLPFSKTSPGLEGLPYQPVHTPSLVIGEPVPTPTVVIAGIDADAVKAMAQEVLGANVDVSAGMSKLLLRRIQESGKIHVEKKDAPGLGSTMGDYRLVVKVVKLGYPDPYVAPEKFGPFGTKNPGTALGRFGHGENADAVVDIEFDLFDLKGRVVKNWSSAVSRRPLSERRHWVPLGPDKPVDMTSREFMQSDIGQAFLHACDLIASTVNTQIKMKADSVQKK